MGERRSTDGDRPGGREGGDPGAPGDPPAARSPADRDPLFEATVRDGVLELARPDTVWLSTGWDGGRTRADALHSVTVPEGWDAPAIDDYVADRLSRAGFQRSGPVLITGVDAAHARGARCGPVEAVATAGLSNPAALPADPNGSPRDPDPGSVVDADPIDVDGAGQGGEGRGDPGRDRDGPGDPQPPGTVNVVVATTRDLAPGALANLVAVAAEAKAATLLSVAGVPGTTTDAVVAASDPGGRPTEYSGSGTLVGAAARACVREAVRASLAARYPDGSIPRPDEADHANGTEARAAVYDPADAPAATERPDRRTDPTDDP